MIWRHLYATKGDAEAATRKADAAMRRANGAAADATEALDILKHGNANTEAPQGAPVESEKPVDYDPGDFTVDFENAVA